MQNTQYKACIQIFQKISALSSDSWCHTEHPAVLDATKKRLVHTATCRPGFVHSYYDVHVRSSPRVQPRLAQNSACVGPSGI